MLHHSCQEQSDFFDFFVILSILFRPLCGKWPNMQSTKSARQRDMASAPWVWSTYVQDEKRKTLLHLFVEVHEGLACKKNQKTLYTSSLSSAGENMTRTASAAPSQAASIAGCLCISVTTAYKHIANMYKKWRSPTAKSSSPGSTEPQTGDFGPSETGTYPRGPGFRRGPSPSPAPRPGTRTRPGWR